MAERRRMCALCGEAGRAWSRAGRDASGQQSCVAGRGGGGAGGGGAERGRRR